MGSLLRQAGSIGGQMVKKMIQAYQNNLAGTNVQQTPQELQQIKQQNQPGGNQLL